ncbi:PadR family transcriptional regulator [Sphingomonas sp. SUN039]|nr:PadR family transcriptional regulator [Sphingomonas sp. SUN039]UVO55794.1 PadR family transcriptional regulator [Sphingomonas sp. SUN039]
MMGHGRGLRGGGRDGNGGGRRGRMFDGGELKLVLLGLIGEAPRHGYDLIREIEERTGGAYAPSPGVIYPTLTLLDDMGLIEGVADGTKKQFAITEAGRAELDAKAAELKALMDRLAELGAQRAKTDTGPVSRAMGNLRAVLANRVTADGVTPETLHDIAALLDEVAQKVERL